VNNDSRVLWTVIAALIALIFGLLASFITWMTDHSIAASLSAGGTAFATAVTVMAVLMGMLGVFDGPKQ
jgi:hypothetical protein